MASCILPCHLGPEVDLLHVNGLRVQGCQDVAKDDPVPEGVDQVLDLGQGVVGRQDLQLVGQPVPALPPKLTTHLVTALSLPPDRLYF